LDQLTEGIVSKRSNAPYRPGRNDAWLKSKCIKEQELVIGGYTEQPPVCRAFQARVIKSRIAQGDLDAYLLRGTTMVS
jgi:bifunctional non-homologous end joining protein LigD